MKKEYVKPSMIVTNYNAMDEISLTRNVSAAIALNNIGTGNISRKSFTLHS